MRKSGILLHISSLYNENGHGDFGKSAENFVDFLEKSKQKLWQILPLGPVGYGGSPYQSYSVFAGECDFINLDKLIEDDLLSQCDIDTNNKSQAIEKAAIRFLENNENSGYNQFLEKQKNWLDDFAIFMILKKYNKGLPWYDWSEEYKKRDDKAIEDFAKTHATEIEIEKVKQYLFFKQWANLKQYANSKAIEILGDMPIYPSSDSADVWAYIDLFQYDEDCQPTAVAGVPPDYFSEEGQLWGNPLYNWENEKVLTWWLNRVKHNLEIFDSVRIDHFRGLESYWSVSNAETTAINGHWEKAKGYELLEMLKQHIDIKRIIAEDLGIITPEVEHLRDSFGLLGMKVLQFAFTAGYESSYLPHLIPQNSIVYTATHDNNTTIGWHNDETRSIADKNFALKYLNCENDSIAKAIIRAAWASAAQIAIAPMQDFLELDETARMNTPGTIENNWDWQMSKDSLSDDLAKAIAEITEIYFR